MAVCSLALVAVWLMPSLRLVPLWIRLHIGRSRFPDRDELLVSAYPVWRALATRYGAVPAGCTVREYVDSLPVEMKEIREMLYDFTADWEKIAYDAGPMERSRCIAYMRRCLWISKKVA